MSFPVVIEACEDQFAASLLGAPNVRVVRPTRSLVISALTDEIQQRIKEGELASLEIDMIGVSGIAGKYEKDPTLREICRNAYQRRADEMKS